MHWGVVGKVGRGGGSVAAAPGRQSPRGGKLSISNEKEIRFSALNKLRIIHQYERKFNKRSRTF